MVVGYRKYILYINFYVVEDMEDAGDRLEAGKSTLSDFDENSFK